tara:strand:- start:3299 stop:5836 length:2538 start_codon:yes stop_codon:yes gene_type:complete
MVGILSPLLQLGRLGARGLGALNRTRFIGLGTRTPGAVRRSGGLEGLFLGADIGAATDEDATPLETAGYSGLAALLAPSAIQKLITGREIPTTTRLGRNIGRAGRLGTIASLGVLPLELFGGEPNQDIVSPAVVDSAVQQKINEQKVKDAQDASGADSETKVNQSEALNQKVAEIYSKELTKEQEEAVRIFQNSEKTKADKEKLDTTLADIAAKSNEAIKKDPNKTPAEVVKDKEDLNQETLPKIDENNIETAIPSMKAEASKDRITENNPTGSVEGALLEKLNIGVDFGNLNALSEHRENLYTKYQRNLDDYEKKIQDDFDQKQTFEEYKARYADALGDTNFEKNMALIKFGLNMIGGRSFDKGLQGALDITTRSGNTLIDDISAIKANEKKQNLALLNSYMGYEKIMEANLSQGEKDVFNKNQALISQKVGDISADRNKYLQFLIDKELATLKNEQLAITARNKAGKIKSKQFALIDTPNANMFGKTRYEFATDEAGRIGVIDQESFQKDGTVRITPLAEVKVKTLVNGELKDTTLDKVYANRQDIKVNNKQRDNALVGMNMAKTAVGFINDVIRIQQKGDLKLGTAGYTRGLGISLVENFKDLGSMFFEKGGKDDIATVISEMDTTDPKRLNAFLDTKFDQQYKNRLLGSIPTGVTWKGKDEYLRKFDQDMADTRLEVSKILADKDDTAKRVGKRMGVNLDKFTGAERDNVINQIALLRTIEARMKYLLANANKPTDRLTVADVNAAAERTQILVFGRSDAEVAAAYRNLNPEFQGAFKTNAQIYINNGGDPTVAEDFKMMDMYKTYANTIGEPVTKDATEGEFDSQILKDVFPQGLPTLSK